MNEPKDVAVLMLDATAGDMPEPWRGVTLALLSEALSGAPIVNACLEDERDQLRAEVQRLRHVLVDIGVQAQHTGVLAIVKMVTEAMWPDEKPRTAHPSVNRKDP